MRAKWKREEKKEKVLFLKIFKRYIYFALYFYAPCTLLLGLEKVTVSMAKFHPNQK